jgi:methionyl aminopeptidase
MTPETIQNILKAGKIASQVRRETAAKLQTPGYSYLKAMDEAEQRIIKLGGQIAWAQMAINDVAAHYCPTEDDQSISQEGQLIKVDIGVHLNGYLADNAMTIEVGTTKQYKDHIKAAQNALKAAIKLVRPGLPIWQLGEAQMSEAQALGLTTVKNLSGHTIEQYRVHGGISIPSYNNKDKTELEENTQIAIEPFVTEGTGLIKEKGQATIFMVEKQRSTRSLYGQRILNHPQVKAQNGFPFTTRWLTNSLGKSPTLLGLKQLQQDGIIKAYPPLAEISKGMVAQFEHSMIVGDKTKVYTRNEDDEW